MTNPNLTQAREWAKRRVSLNYFNAEQTQAAVDVIQSLPDRWVDAEKLERIIAGMDCCLTQGSETNFSDGFNEATTTWRDALKALITPKLPTLADMTREEQEACQWMQAKIHGLSDLVGVIFFLEHGRAKIMLRDGTFWTQDDDEVTPLPDLPKLKWPGNEVVEPPALPEGMRLADHEECGRVVVSPKTDTHGHYSVLCLDIGHRTGASYHYAKPNHLTFLDGEV